MLLQNSICIHCIKLYRCSYLLALILYLSFLQTSKGPFNVVKAIKEPFTYLSLQNKLVVKSGSRFFLLFGQKTMRINYIETLDISRNLLFFCFLYQRSYMAVTTSLSLKQRRIRNEKLFQKQFISGIRSEKFMANVK